MPKTKTSKPARDQRAELLALLDKFSGLSGLSAWEVTFGQVDERNKLLAEAPDCKKTWRVSLDDAEQAAFEVKQREVGQRDYEQCHRHAETLRGIVISMALDYERAGALLGSVAPELVDQLPVVDFYRLPHPDPATLAAKVRKVAALVRAQAPKIVPETSANGEAKPRGKAKPKGKPGPKRKNPNLDALIESEWASGKYSNRHKLLKESPALEELRKNPNAPRLVILSMARIRSSRCAAKKPSLRKSRKGS